MVDERQRSEIGSPISSAVSARWFRAIYDTPLLLSGILDGRGRVLDANRLCVEGCDLDRAAILGRPFWECGWWSPDAELSAQVRRWFEQAMATGQPIRTASHYFLGDGTRRMLDLALSPVRNADGDGYLVVLGSDITEAVVSRQQRERLITIEAEALRSEAEAQANELVVVRDAERRTGDRLRLLVGIALELVTVETLEDLTEVVLDRALPLLGADDGVVLVRTGANAARVSVSDRLGHGDQAAYREVPLSSPLPSTYTARTGLEVLLPDRAAGLAFAPEMAEVYRSTQREAWAYFPLRAGIRLIGSLAVAWRAERDFAEEEVSLLRAFAAQCAQALDRVQHLQRDRERAVAAQRLSETLQRSLLTQPPTPDALEIAVRYQAATEEAQVGGDWYDAFITAGGATMLAIGDIAGHDRVAAASMGQVRNVLRGLVYDSDDSPAVHLNRLDRALRGLRVNVVATAVLARIAEPAGDRGGVRELHWSNAGHLPPLLRRPDGTVVVLDRRPNLLLGVDPHISRDEHVIDLDEGSTLLLYTDGLVERRNTDIDTGITDLVRLFEQIGHQPPEQLCDALLRSVAPDHEDDIALLVLRCGPLTQPLWLAAPPRA